MLVVDFSASAALSVHRQSIRELGGGTDRDFVPMYLHGYSARPQPPGSRLQPGNLLAAQPPLQARGGQCRSRRSAAAATAALALSGRQWQRRRDVLEAGGDRHVASRRRVASRLRVAASRRVASRRVASRRVASRHVAARRVASRHVASRRVASCRCASRRMTDRRVVSSTLAAVSFGH
jgi:hypothetical protein